MTKKGIIIGVAVVLLLITAFGFTTLKKDKEAEKSSGGSSSSNSSGANSYPIKYGQKGELVRVLQERINATGYYPKLKTDGDYGPLTKKAVASVIGGSGQSVSYTQFNALKNKSNNRGSSNSIDTVEFAARFNVAVKKGYDNKENSEVIDLLKVLINSSHENIKRYVQTTQDLYDISVLAVAHKVKPKDLSEEIITKKAVINIGIALTVG